MRFLRVVISIQLLWCSLERFSVGFQILDFDCLQIIFVAVADMCVARFLQELRNPSESVSGAALI